MPPNLRDHTRGRGLPPKAGTPPARAGRLSTPPSSSYEDPTPGSMASLALKPPLTTYAPAPLSSGVLQTLPKKLREEVIKRMEVHKKFVTEQEEFIIELEGRRKEFQEMAEMASKKKEHEKGVGHNCAEMLLGELKHRMPPLIWKEKTRRGEIGRYTEAVKWWRDVIDDKDEKFENDLRFGEPESESGKEEKKPAPEVEKGDEDINLAEPTPGNYRIEVHEDPTPVDPSPIIPPNILWQDTSSAHPASSHSSATLCRHNSVSEDSKLTGQTSVNNSYSSVASEYSVVGPPIPMFPLFSDFFQTPSPSTESEYSDPVVSDLTPNGENLVTDTEARGDGKGRGKARGGATGTTPRGRGGTTPRGRGRGGRTGAGTTPRTGNAKRRGNATGTGKLPGTVAMQSVRGRGRGRGRGGRGGRGRARAGEE